ncbi:MAG: alpha/beta hydrolase [Rhizobiales bacterium]|nr:alpha/beta hydrolase [Hyphomicrobiales bacterium]
MTDGDTTLAQQATSIVDRNNVKVRGSTGQAVLFAHGFGCDQEMWRFVAPAFEVDHQIVLYDLTGFGKSDVSAYDFNTYSDLSVHADDIIALCNELNLENVVLVGHSVSATIAVLAANAAPEKFDRLVLLSPSPCFLKIGDYDGGFEEDAIEGLIEAMEANYLGWSEQTAPMIAGQPPDGQAAQDLTKSFCQTDPTIAKHFGRQTFLADNRDDMTRLTIPCLIVQCENDPIAPVSVGNWMHDNMPTSTLERVPVTGHCPHMTNPNLTIDAIRRYLDASTG